MKLFEFAVGNPPYQEETANKGDRANPVYGRFMESACRVSEKAVLITPARFLFNAGQTSKRWNQKMLSDGRLKVLLYESDSKKIFPGADIKGGLAVTLRHGSKAGGAGDFSVYPELAEIVRKMQEKREYSVSLDSLVSSRGLYRFSPKFYEDFPYAAARVGKGSGNMLVSNIFAALPKAFSDEPPEALPDAPPEAENAYLAVVGRQNGRRIVKYIRREYIIDNKYIDKYKVILPEANGAGVFGEVLSAPAVCDPLSGAVDTFISFGPFDSREEAEALLKYLKSRFARALLGLNKVTQHNSRSVWRDVPLQNFTAASDIDWTKPIPDIDGQLYGKYGLSEEEIAFIETRVKEMR